MRGVWRIDNLGHKIEVRKEALKECEASADLHLETEERREWEEEAALQRGEGNDVANGWRVWRPRCRQRS